jgi:hypothetical protein
MTTDMEALRDRYLDEHGHHADAQHGFESGWAALSEACRVVYDGPGTFDERVARILNLSAFAPKHSSEREL